MHVERILAANPLSEALDEVVGAANGVDPLAAAPDALVGMDLHEEAAANVAALQFGDAQRGRARRLLRVVDGLPECGQRPRSGGCRQPTGQSGTNAARARVCHSSSDHSSRYLISKMNTRPPAPGAGPSCTVPADTNIAFGVVAGVAPVEDQLDGVLDVTMHRSGGAGRDRPRVAPLVPPRWGAEDLMQAVGRLDDFGARRRALHFHQNRAHRRIARAFLDMRVAGHVRLKDPGLRVGQPAGGLPSETPLS